MNHGLSLRVRLSLRQSAMLILAGMAIFAAFIVQARSGIREEVRAAAEQARRLLNSDETGEPIAVSAAQLRRLQTLRHLRLLTLSENDEKLKPDVPRLFALLLDSANAPRDAIRLRSDHVEYWLVTATADEIEEVWDEVTSIALWSALGFLLLNLVVWMEVGRLLQPLRTLRLGLQQIEQGLLQVRLEPFRGADLAPLSAGFNRMADVLADTRRSLHELHAKFFDLQEQERKQLSRDLHDEFGQTLTAIRVQVAAMLRSGDLSGNARATAARIDTEAGALMQHLSTMLDKLRPEALDMLGLASALMDLTERGSCRFPDASIELRYDAAKPAGQRAGINVYRLVQEAMTNAIRHSGADRVRIAVADQDAEVVVTVEDNGRGMTAEHRRGGFGLAGMRERIESFGGSFCIDSSECGVLVTARIPFQRWCL